MLFVCLTNKITDLYVMSYMRTYHVLYTLHMHVVHKHDRYVFMYVREMYLYIKNLILDLGLEWFEMRHDLGHEILMSRS